MPVLSSLPRAFSALPFYFSITIIVFLTIFTRLIHILPGFTPRPPSPLRRRKCPSHIVIVLGSGGHTAEMLSLIRKLDPRRYIYRTYIVSSEDQFSATKATEFEALLSEKWKNDFENRIAGDAGRAKGLRKGRVLGDEEDKEIQGQMKDEKEEQLVKDGGKFKLITVPRARKIHQPLYTTPFTSLACLWSCISALRSSEWPMPDMILTNGPATGVIVVLASLLLRFFALDGNGELGQLKTIYVESWARVKTLSLSGRILQWGLVDRFLVQWEGLKGGNKEYKGVLVE